MPLTKIRAVKSLEELDQVYRLRYDTYVNELKLDLTEVDHARQMFTTDLDKHATILAALDDRRVVGTVAIAFAIDIKKYVDFFQMQRFGTYYPAAVSMTSKFAVSRDYRYDPNDMVIERLAVAAFKVFLSKGMRFDNIFCDTGNGRPRDFPRLKRFYERLGYRQILSDVKLPGFGECHRLVLAVNDRDYLCQVNSPFAKYVSDADDSVDYFYKHILSEAEIRKKGNHHVG